MKYTKQEVLDFLKAFEQEVNDNRLTEKSMKTYEALTAYFNLLDPNIEPVIFKEET